MIWENEKRIERNAKSGAGLVPSFVTSSTQSKWHFDYGEGFSLDTEQQKNIEALQTFWAER